MGGEDVSEIRRAARERIAGRPNMVLDGDPIEELARAHERHAERLEEVLPGLLSVGQTNYLGDTSEGRAATHNIRIAVQEHPRSVAESIRGQASDARKIARALRSIGASLRAAEANGADGIEGVARADGAAGAEGPRQ